MDFEIKRLIDVPKAKRIVAIVAGHGRLVLFEDETYPQGGIGSINEAQINQAIKTQIKNG